MTRRAKITKGKEKIRKKTLKPVKRKKPDKTERTAKLKKALKRMSTKRTIINAVHK